MFLRDSFQYCARRAGFRSDNAVDMYSEGT